MPAVDKLIEIDSEALIELADNISYGMGKLNWAREIIPFLDHLESIVLLGNFDKHMAYLRATYLYIALDDREGACRELTKLGTILEYGRRKALELYLDVCGSDLSERQRIAIAESIITQSGTDDHVRVQYTAIKAMGLLQVGERAQGSEELRAVLATTQPPSRVETAEETFAIWQLANAWALYGKFNDDEASLSKAEELLLRIPEDTMTPLGRSVLLLELGWVLRDQEKYRDAAAAFRRSLELNAATVTKIHLAHSLALCGEIDEARTLQRELDSTTIEADAQLESLASKGSLAIAAADKSLALETVEGLKRMGI
jgi:tetratricopeptide (TPR) repeat protein